MSNNNLIAENQQGSLNDPSETIRRAPFLKKDDDIVHAIWRHMD